MNYQKAFQSLQAAFRAARAQIQRLRVRLDDSERRYQALVNNDAEIAALVDRNYALSLQVKDKQKNLDYAKAELLDMQRRFDMLRTVAGQRAESLANQKKYTAGWAYAFLALGLGSGAFHIGALYFGW